MRSFIYRIVLSALLLVYFGSLGILRIDIDFFLFDICDDKNMNSFYATNVLLSTFCWPATTCKTKKNRQLIIELAFSFSGMAWSFRFATLNRDKMPPIMVLPQHPHLDIKSWLELLDLPQYDGKSLSKPNDTNDLPYKNISNTLSN